MEPSSAHDFMTIQKKQNWVTEKKKWLQNGITPILKIARWENEKIFLGSCHAWDLGVLYCGSCPNPLLPFSFCPRSQRQNDRMHCISACAEFSKWPTPWPSGYWTWWGLDQAAFVCLLCQSFIMLKLFRTNILWLVLERVKISESWIQSCVKSSYWS